VTRFDVEVRVMPRATLLDPQGQAVEHALAALGFQGVERVRVGRAVTFSLARASTTQAERDVRAMCERLLANPVTEDFTVSLRAGAAT
jgi:phosphoribosylformylglycinamidine synthase